MTSDGIDRDSHVPWWEQLTALLRTRIEQGEWAAGRRLPPERQFADQYGVSKSTVRKALAPLKAEGLIARQHGVANYIPPREPG